MAGIPKQPEPERDRYGRPLIPPTEGNGKPKPYTRVTTLAGTMSDRYNLEMWSCRMTAVGLAQRPDLLALASATSPDDNKQLNKIVNDAKEAASSSKGANFGTALHEITEQIDTGRIEAVPEMFETHIQLYKQTLKSNNIEIIPEMVERFVLNDQLQVAGTADRIVKHGNKYYIADLKTGKWLNWGEIEIQLACYANADAWYDTNKKKRFGPTVEVDTTTGIVIHLPSGEQECTIHWVDLKRGYQAAKLAAKVRGWRNSSKPIDPPKQAVRRRVPKPKPEPQVTQKAETIIEETLVLDPTVQLREWVLTRMKWLKANHPKTLNHLSKQWPKNIPTFKQSKDHTIQQLEAIHEQLATIEKTLEVPFPEDIAPTRSNLALQYAVDLDFTMVPAIIFAATKQTENPTTIHTDLDEDAIVRLQRICQGIHDNLLVMIADTAAPGGWRVEAHNQVQEQQLPI